jgi:hypothetical protein
MAHGAGSHTGSQIAQAQDADRLRPGDPRWRTIPGGRIGAGALVLCVGIATVPAVHAVADLIARWVA